MSAAAELIARAKVEGVSQAQKSITTLGDAVDDVAKRSANAAAKQKQHSDSLDKVGKGALVAGGALLAGFGLATHAVMGFDKEMSGVASVANASAGDLDKLRTAAVNAGRDTAFSASEAAAAEGELVKAGVSVSDVLGGALSGTLSLAAAGQLDLASAATISAQAMNLFGLKGKDVGHIADVLAAGANKSAADVSTLADALQQGGLVAKQTGLSLEDTVGTLSLFADNALNGSDAGTSLKTMLQRLTPQSAEAASLMQELGISAYDSAGQFVGMSKYAGLLHDKLGGLTVEQRNTAFATIFGSDAVRAAGILYNAGADGVSEYTKAVNDQGAASRMAATQLDNLSGDLEQLKGSVETALIQGGSKATGVLRGLTQSATGLVNEFAAAPQWLQSTAIGFTGVAGTALAGAGAIGTMVPKIREAKEAFSNMSSTSKVAMGGVTAALTIGALALADWAKKKEEARQRVQEFVTALQADGGAIGSNTAEYIKAQLVKKGLADDVEKLQGKLSSGRNAFEVYTAAVSGDKDAMAELLRAMKGSEGGMGGLLVTTGALSHGFRDGKTQTDALAKSQKTAADVQNELAGATAALNDLAAQGVTKGEKYDAAVKRLTAAQTAQNTVTDASKTALKGAQGAQADFGAAADAAAKKVKEETDAVNDAVDAIFGFRDTLRDAGHAQIDFQRAQEAVTDKLAAYNDAVRAHGKNSREAKDALLDYQESILNVGSAQDKATQATAAAAAVTLGYADAGDAVAHGGGARLIANLQEQANHLAPGSPLRVGLEEYIRKLKTEIPTEITTRVEALYHVSASGAVSVSSGNSRRQASGGQADGPTIVNDGAGNEVLVSPLGGQVVSYSDAVHATGTAKGGGGDMSAVVAELRAVRAAVSKIQGGTEIFNGAGTEEVVREVKRRDARKARLTAGVG